MSRHSNTPATDASVLLVQLSDSHLFAEDGARLLGMDTAHSLEKVVERVAREQPRIDLILATGDVSQDGSLDSYTRFRRLSAPWTRRCAGSPVTTTNASRCKGRPRAATCWSRSSTSATGAWCCSTSSIPGAVPGYLEEDQLELLRRAIDSAGERFLLVSFHHHPVPIGSDWMDPIGLRNPQALFDLLAPYPQVRCLLWGTFTRSSTASAARCACWLRRPPAYSSPPAAATSPSTAWRRATAGCACTTTGAWKRGSRGSTTSSSKWTTTPPDTDMPPDAGYRGHVRRCRSARRLEDEAWKLLPFGFPY